MDSRLLAISSDFGYGGTFMLMLLTEWVVSESQFNNRKTAYSRYLYCIKIPVVDSNSWIGHLA
jgi:hypothetical protein